MNWDYCLDEPDDEFYELDEDYVDGDEDCDYDDSHDIEDLVGDYRSDEYERIINQNY